MTMPQMRARGPLRAAETVLPALALLAVAAQPSGAQTTHYVGATVIDGVSDAPIPDATIIVVDGTIRSIEQGAPTRTPAGVTVVDLRGRYVTPGLIDTHVHIGDVQAARRALRSGVTTARSMGTGFFVDVGLRELGRVWHIESPEILAAGYHVRPGPAEGLFIDEPSLADLMRSGVHGEDAVRRMVRAMTARGVDFIKTNATERAGLPETDPRKQLFDETELRAIVGEAEAAGIPVAAHAHGDPGGRAAVRAGVRSIEHGTYLSDETLDMMAERGTYLVPTIAVVEDLTKPGGDYDSPVLQMRGRHMLPRVRRMASSAHGRGVRIAAATDTGYGPGSVVRLSHELMELVGVGLTPMEALRAATTTAAELLRVDGRTGRLAAGFEADFLVVEQNPLEDIAAMQDVLMVVSDGRVVLDRVEM